VVITGASSGMGKELTYRYAQRGSKIVIGSRTIEKLQEVLRMAFNSYRLLMIVMLSVLNPRS